jgi:hypothetical protein
MVKNGEGKVALKHHNSNPSRPIQIGDTIYQASPQHNISLMWVDESHVDKILNSPELKTKGCNCGGGVTKPLFSLANELDVSLFNTGDRPR